MADQSTGPESSDRLIVYTTGSYRLMISEPNIPLTVAVVAEGNANTPDCWSGVGKGFVDGLRRNGITVDVFDVRLRSWQRLLAAAWTFHPVRRRWKQRFILGANPFRARSALADRLLGSANRNYDAVIQFGATFLISTDARRGAPYFLYCDANLAYARRSPFSGASRLHEDEVNDAIERERRVYAEADHIWTMSAAVAQSFQADFGQPSVKVRPIYAGANNPPSPGQARGAPSILFIGKDHVRKGSGVLLAAFKRVRQSIPDAELHMVGGSSPSFTQPGVFAHGVLSRATAEGRKTLDALFGGATVFCMPSRFEPFGIVFIEAMLAGLPCIGTTSWAMPEIIINGETGWLVPDGSVEELATVLIEALADPARSARLGLKGRERMVANFTWDLTARRAIDDLERFRAERTNDSPTSAVS